VDLNLLQLGRFIMAFSQKLLIRGGTGMPLHERFTQLTQQPAISSRGGRGGRSGVRVRGSRLPHGGGGSGFEDDLSASSKPWGPPQSALVTPPRRSAPPTSSNVFRFPLTSFLIIGRNHIKLISILIHIKFINEQMLNNV